MVYFFLCCLAFFFYFLYFSFFFRYVAQTAAAVGVGSTQLRELLSGARRSNAIRAGIRRGDSAWDPGVDRRGEGTRDPQGMRGHGTAGGSRARNAREGIKGRARTSVGAAQGRGDRDRGSPSIQLRTCRRCSSSARHRRRAVFPAPIALLRRSSDHPQAVASGGSWPEQAVRLRSGR